MSLVRLSVPVVAFALVVVVGCAPIEGPVVVQALVADPAVEGGVAFDDVTLETVKDLQTGHGSLFDARGGLRLAGLDVSQSAEAGDSFEEMRDKARGDGGTDMNPRMSFDGTRWVADDLVTLTYFTAWAHIEHAWLFARDVVGDDSPATSEHSLVGIEASVVFADALPVPILTSDNAAYAAPLDAWLTLRVGSQEGVPFAMSFPVLAHEVHHRIFHRNVFGTPEAFEIWRARLEQPTEEERRATRILQGVDEGLADLFSLAATRDPDGLRRTFVDAGGRFAPEGDRRDLEGAFADAATYALLRDNALDASLLSACNSAGSSDLYNEDGFNFYCIGTVLARALWDGSDRDVDVLSTEVLPAVNRALPKVGDTLATGALFDVDVLLAPLVDELPAGARRSTVCQHLAEKFDEIVAEGRVPGCS